MKNKKLHLHVYQDNKRYVVEDYDSGEVLYKTVIWDRVRTFLKGVRVGAIAEVDVSQNVVM